MKIVHVAAILMLGRPNFKKSKHHVKFIAPMRRVVLWKNFRKITKTVRVAVILKLGRPNFKSMPGRPGFHSRKGFSVFETRPTTRFHQSRFNARNCESNLLPHFLRVTNHARGTPHFCQSAVTPRHHLKSGQEHGARRQW